VPGECDSRGVAAEEVDVVLNPSECGDLVLKSEVCDSAVYGVVEAAEAFDAEPVVDGHLDHTVAGEGAMLVGGVASCAEGEATTV